LRAVAGSGTIGAVQPAEPSQTAKFAAIARGQHRLTFRQPWILDDPYALSLVGAAWEQLYAQLRAIFPDRVLEEAMTGIVARSRYVEDALQTGTFEQYVILGAGLDSFARRRPDMLASTRVFEVDHPTTQAWKRERAEVMALPRSDRHVFAPVDFESDTLDAGLAAVGFDPSASTLFSWIAVMPYLTIDAIETTLHGLVRAARGSQVALSYGVREEYLDDVGRRFISLLQRVATQRGEPLVTLLSPTEAEDLLSRCGLSVLDHLDRLALSERYVAGRTDVPLPYTVERVITAAVPRCDQALAHLRRHGIAEEPEAVVGDAGYWHTRQIHAIQDRGIEVLVPPDGAMREGNRPGWEDGLYEQMREKLKTAHGRTLYALRKTTIEPVFGQIKYNRRIDQFMRRGRAAVQSELRLVAATHNMLKLHNHWISNPA
jgi:methyltransferase (TIGR00027 family)